MDVTGMFRLLLAWTVTEFVVCGEYCFHYQDGVEYCSSGCCGSALHEYCCLLASWTIVLLVIGALIMTGVVIFICMFYYCKKRGRTNGRVVFPLQQSTTVATVHTVQYPGYSVYPSAPPIQPPPYSSGNYYQGGSNLQPGQQPGQQQQPQQQPQQPQPDGPDSSHYAPPVYDPPQYNNGNQSSVYHTRGLDPAYPPPQFNS